MLIEPHVYFVESGPGGPIKIGWSQNLRRRLHDLQQSSVAVLRLLVAFPGTRVDEKRLHRHFDAERIRGEWFRGDGRVRALTDDMKRRPLPDFITTVEPLRRFMPAGPRKRARWR